MKLLPHHWYEPFVLLARLMLAGVLFGVAMVLFAWPLMKLLEYMPPTISFKMVAISLLYYLAVIAIGAASLKLVWSFPLSRIATGESPMGRRPVWEKLKGH